jgi:predicted TIM-barrel fold metal-dependent hydrolase
MGPFQPVEEILANPYLSEQEKQQICGQNAAALLGIQI